MKRIELIKKIAELGANFERHGAFLGVGSTYCALFCLGVCYRQGDGMFAVKGVYDGRVAKPQDEVPFNENYEVVITFLKPRCANASVEHTEVLHKVRAWDKPDSLLNNPLHVGEGFRVFSKEELHER
jgi:hypothetical protein